MRTKRKRPPENRYLPHGVRVKVSAAQARQEFAGCSPDYIATKCRATCCRSTTAVTGIMVTIHPTERAAIEARGVVVQDGLILPRPGERRCPFQNTETQLCDIHFTDDKPFGCIASPFTLSSSGETLIVRNRYRRLICYKDGDRIPAYRAFRASLDLIFGLDEAQRIVDLLDAGSGDVVAVMPHATYRRLRANDAVKKTAERIGVDSGRDTP
jgi:Fe-S-cluster containining protein